MSGSVSVFVHIPDGRGNWRNERRAFARVPSIGEHLVLSDRGNWHQVRVVVHCPFEGADFDAEIYAVPADHVQVINAESGEGAYGKSR